MQATFNTNHISHNIQNSLGELAGPSRSREHMMRKSARLVRQDQTAAWDPVECRLEEASSYIDDSLGGATHGFNKHTCLVENFEFDEDRFLCALRLLRYVLDEYLELGDAHDARKTLETIDKWAASDSPRRTTSQSHKLSMVKILDNTLDPLCATTSQDRVPSKEDIFKPIAGYILLPTNPITIRSNAVLSFAIAILAFEALNLLGDASKYASNEYFGASKRQTALQVII